MAKFGGKQPAGACVLMFGFFVSKIQIAYKFSYWKLCNLDRHDRQILAILQTDGRISNQDLADRIGLSPSPLPAPGAGAEEST